jgi:uncharacterized membrane protein YgcG
MGSGGSPSATQAAGSPPTTASQGAPPGVRDQGATAASQVANTVTEITERSTVLIQEQIELVKAEVTEKVNSLARGAAVGVAAGIFAVTALYFLLVGLAWLLYYYLPIGSAFTFFWGFFAMALILLVLGLIAGLVAARFLKRGAPPTPDMAIEEARKIRETVAPSGADAGSTGAGAGSSVAGADSSGDGAASRGDAGASRGDGASREVS